MDEVNASSETVREPSDQTIGNEVRVHDAPPPSLSRPIGLVEGIGYAVSYPWVEMTIRERELPSGQVEVLESPITERGYRPRLVRQDGAVFADHPGDGEQSGGESGVLLQLDSLPPTDRTISWPAVRRYQTGSRQSGVAVYTLALRVIKRFVDLDYLKGYDELVACWVIATYFLESFGVFGYLWINGVSGSGKTQLLTVISELSCLGTLLTPGSSFATIRDLANLGATLCLDDAEQALGPRADSDKVALMHSGNRRGILTPVKQAEGHRGWVTRYVNTYTARAFSAIALPTSAMARRSIIIPMNRSTDAKRANSDPTNHDDWGMGRRTLLDLLWSTALSNISKMPDYDRRAVEMSGLSGAALAPWRAPMAVALWLDEGGVNGIFERVMALAHAYQRERSEFEPDNLVVLAIRGLAAATERSGDGLLVAETSAVTKKVKELASDELGIAPGDATARRVGRVLSQLGLVPLPRPGGKGGRRWGLSDSKLAELQQAFGITEEQSHEETT